jgi:MFS family permease
MAEVGTPKRLRAVLVPLALAQFICSFAGSNMNVMINDISADLGTTVQGVQVTITIFLLVMAALMIPGGKLTDRFGRKRCFMAGLTVYGVGAALSAVSPGLGVLILGNSILEGIGTAMLIPPVYILATVLFPELTGRARAFGAIMALGGIGAATGPLIGGLLTAALSWRAAFAFQALVIVVILLLSRQINDPLPPDPTRSFDTGGAILSAVGLVLIVMGILAADNNVWLMLGLLVLGTLALVWFFLSVRAKEAKEKAFPRKLGDADSGSTVRSASSANETGREPLISTSVFRNRASNLGLVTQNTQWLLLMGTSFVVAAYLQVVRGYDAIQTGVIFTSATLGLLGSSLAAERLAKRRAQRTLITSGFVLTIAGIGVLLGMAGGAANPWASAPGLLLIGLGLGLMLTPSVNVVQSSFPEERQGEISGVSRSVSNLGSALGAAIAGTIIVANPTGHGYAVAMITLAAIGLIGLVAAAFLPRTLAPTA